MLKATNIGFHYRSADWLFRNINVELPAGKCMAVLGPNARGKTTLLTCLARIREPLEGSVEHDGQIGYVPQNTQTSFQFTAFDMVLMGTARHRSPWQMPSTQDEEQALKALKRVGIEHLAQRLFSAMSGGQRQLVLIARALASDPATLILDEPTSALDLHNQARTLSIMHQLCNEGIGVIFTTHDPTHALNIADHTLMMSSDISCSESRAQLNEHKLSGLYKLPVRTPHVDFISGKRQVVVPDLLSLKGGNNGHSTETSDGQTR
ncbi:ABC transporter ATP-binding protein [Corynebacterium belfantii]|uniref:ABC transporter ATP-binding protein n=1 Tax=Corynebacterium belfantii TaxID=2014537 RepID=A0ABS0LC30_9CORY|nr:ABC transporter ATP-binding protein [Corynebacterium belfantii]QBZ29360.1 ABC transporter ATP-binding protein [Corynebacterium diphtheriae subsp. lausannense]MBG9243580.1 ABC transporter ATP-binding protein [Corynebacterium belfantii]MBG9258945.1 ABC transporter ATP-binding protein [Corynebacterium belfantii]MBG9288693.1 ABC transporter ATP-binding protein [Corynebacterium belfantii]MBG9310166.1 ABC transporter ATP-binding protein [Corynebacterium belfantii]